MKVMLISSPAIEDQSVITQNSFPTGLLYLATILKKNAIDTIIIDLKTYCENNLFDYVKGLNEEVFHEYIENELFNKIREYQPDIIGIGCLFSGSFPSLKIIAQKIKNTFQHIKIVIGGMHPTLFAKAILEKYAYIDYVVIGEGEYTLLNIVRNFKKKNSMDFIDGLALRENGKILEYAKTKFEENLDNFPFMDYTLINLNDYKRDTSKWFSPKKIKIGQPFPVISSRSCPNQCTFCSMWRVHGKRIRFRSAKNVVDELVFLFKNFNAHYFSFMDDNLTLNKKRMMDICYGIIKQKIDIQFDAPNGLSINALDQELIDLMVKTGLVRVNLAIESGSEKIRFESMKKYVTTKKINEVVYACAKHNNLFICGYFVIGMPEETHETLNETFELIKKLPLDTFGMYFATPFPGTELFNECIKNKLIHYNPSEYLDIKDLQYSADRPHFKPYNLSKEDLIKFRNKCFNYMNQKRGLSPLPSNYPLRYRPN